MELLQGKRSPHGHSRGQAGFEPAGIEKGPHTHLPHNLLFMQELRKEGKDDLDIIVLDSDPWWFWYEKLLNWLYFSWVTVMLVAAEEPAEHIMTAPTTSLLWMAVTWKRGWLKQEQHC